MNQELIASTFKNSELDDITQQLPLRTGRDKAVSGNGTTLHSASHVAVRH